jgi:hypothetical protein
MQPILFLINFSFLTQSAYVDSAQISNLEALKKMAVDTVVMTIGILSLNSYSEPE